MMMDPTTFDLLLSGDLGSLVQWSRSHKCPCADDNGGASQDCPVCIGLGVFWDTPSAAFRCGVLGLSERDAGRMARKMGTAFSGDGQISIPPSAPFCGQVKPCDRFLVVDAVDTVEWVISRRAPVRLPVGAEIVSVYTLSSGLVAQGVLPDPGADGRIVVLKPYTVRMKVPRLFEIIEGAGHIRAWQVGLPQKYAMKRIDITTR